jgi:hypothetical protein
MVMGAAQRVAGAVDNDPKSRESKDYVKALVKLIGTHGNLLANQVGQIEPAIPLGVFAIGQATQDDGRPRVAVPRDGGAGRIRLVSLRKKAPVD